MAAGPAEQDDEHEHEADEEGPAAGYSGDPGSAPEVHGLPFRRHLSGAARPLLLRTSLAQAVLRESSFPSRAGSPARGSLLATNPIART